MRGWDSTSRQEEHEADFISHPTQTVGQVFVLSRLREETRDLNSLLFAVLLSRIVLIHTQTHPGICASAASRFLSAHMSWPEASGKNRSRKIPSSVGACAETPCVRSNCTAGVPVLT